MVAFSLAFTPPILRPSIPPTENQPVHVFCLVEKWNVLHAYLNISYYNCSSNNGENTNVKIEDYAKE